MDLLISLSSADVRFDIGGIRSDCCRELLDSSEEFKMDSRETMRMDKKYCEMLPVVVVHLFHEYEAEIHMGTCHVFVQSQDSFKVWYGIFMPGIYIKHSAIK